MLNKRKTQYLSELVIYTCTFYSIMGWGQKGSMLVVYKLQYLQIYRDL